MAWKGYSTSAGCMTTIHCQLKSYKSALIQWKKDMNTKENSKKRGRVHQLGIIQNEGMGEHIDDDHKFQKELQLKMEEDELKWK